MVDGDRIGERLDRLHLHVDDCKVFAALDRLDDLREFARVAQQLADERYCAPRARRYRRADDSDGD